VKKLAAISLICLLAFNWYGFRIVTAILSDNADQQLETRLDNLQYDESQLIELRIPLNVPYQTSQSEFERHYGEMEVNGVFYTYVKSKVENGELVLKCIPNDSKKEIRKAGTNVVLASINNTPVNSGFVYTMYFSGLAGTTDSTKPTANLVVNALY